jgi:hypothetical protein
MYNSFGWIQLQIEIAAAASPSVRVNLRRDADSRLRFGLA